MLIDLQTPFQTLLIENPDFQSGDVNAEIQRLFERQKAISKLIEGTIDAEYLLDILSDQGFDATQYIDEVEQNIDQIIVMMR